MGKTTVYTTQNTILLDNLMKFYTKNNNIDKILPIINGESKISLRLIDWFVTNYSKKHFTIIKGFECIYPLQVTFVCVLLESFIIATQQACYLAHFSITR